MNSVPPQKGVNLYFYRTTFLLGSQQFKTKLNKTFWSDGSKLSHIINGIITKFPLQGTQSGDKALNALSNFWHKQHLNALPLNHRAVKNQKVLGNPTELRKKLTVQRAKLSAFRAARKACDLTARSTKIPYCKIIASKRFANLSNE